MTDTEWGAPIEVNGVRPGWLRGDERHMFRDAAGEWYGEYVDWIIREHDEGDRWADDVMAIRLPANHPYYLATSRGFTYWPGGESAPADWDGGDTLMRDGEILNTTLEAEPFWRHGLGDGDIIGYRKRTEQPAIAPELVERMVAFVKAHRGFDDEADAIIRALDPDLALAKSINGDVEAIAAAIRAARENGRG